MNVSKIFGTAAAALTIVGTAGLVYAQTTTNDAAPSTTTPSTTTPATTPSDASAMPARTMPDTPAARPSTDSSGSMNSPSSGAGTTAPSSDTLSSPGAEPAPRADRN